MKLTKREREVSRLVAEGHTNESIGHQLGIGGATVKKHVQSVTSKLGCANRVELAVMVVTEKYEAKLAQLRAEYGLFDMQSH